MRGHLQQGRGQLVAGWLLAATATLLYLLTMERSVSWWDCGEFITTSHTLQVGHPPGAPVYQLLAHLATLLAFGNPLAVAPLSNALSALAGGLTAMLLYRSIELVASREADGRVHGGAVAGTLCYVLCHTAWTSATESEVYALAMLVCAAEVWLLLRWRQRGGAWRLPLAGLLAGLGVGVHLMTLLALPAMACLLLASRRLRPAAWRPLAAAALFFLLGLTPYAIVPIRAAAHPPINEGDPSSPAAFAASLKRDQYQKAPLWPRRWRERDSLNTAEWTHGLEGTAAEVAYCATYQLGYMYLRYVSDNFLARGYADDPRGWRPYVLPLLMALLGLGACARRGRWTLFWTVMLLFLFGGPVLNLYLNHPCYEPRERDYAYALSFYAVAMWAGLGCCAAWQRAQGRKRWVRVLAALAMALTPATLLAGNLADHNRSRNHAARDVAINHLQSCDDGAILFTLGDNDTFPLWYAQQVEGCRTDVSIHNLNLEGLRHCMEVVRANGGSRPVYLTYHAVQQAAPLFGRHLRCEGYCWRVVGSEAEAADRAPLLRHAGGMAWHLCDSEKADPVTDMFLRIWEESTGLEAR